MKEYKVLYFREIDTPPNPDINYRKLYPKADGWYMLDSEGNEIKIEGLFIIDMDDTILPQKEFLQFMWPFRARVDGNRIVVDLDDADVDADGGLFLEHGNELHNPPFATEQELQGHYNDLEPHGIVLVNIHAQNTDQYLDFDGTNEVSAAEIRASLDRTALGGVVRTSANEYEVIRGYSSYIGNCLANHVKFVLPDVSAMSGSQFTFRHGGGAYAITIERSVSDLINVDGSDWEGITSDVSGFWVTLQSDGTKWYVVADSGIGIANEI